MRNYRSVSNLSFISKVIENAVFRFNQIAHHINRITAYIHFSQRTAAGFSTESALVRVQDLLYWLQL